ncbi:proline dehydrogenase [Colletotrichum karsti]|uniref:proline dehydrogenase n=1 Tax=Colletotrichum karsti TaxID=1095194 RepID=A0A9P6HV05_9PEZI|nr:proline dehydrogenase [Colletotrichum karsti]KAF9871808.1 proline dehydrogenase [Colletotrichum karsti]
MAQLANISWPNFVAFNGQLTVATFQTPAIGGVAQAAIEFTNWLDQIRQNPAHFGFSFAYQAPVVQLLDTFFPAGVRARRFSTGPPPPLQAGQAVALPIMVPYGNTQMGIVDGPTALGYIFSVVSPPAGLDQTWQEYFLPLTVLYSWAVYLAYISFLGAPSTVLPDIEAVPRMTCVMYLERKNLAPYFFLGQTKARAGRNTAQWAQDELDNKLCLNYRAQMVFNAAQFGNPPLPEASDQWQVRMRETLFEILPGANGPLLAVEDFLQQVFSGWANNQNIQALLPPLPVGFGVVDMLADLQRLLLAVTIAAWVNAGTPMSWPPGNMASANRLRNAHTQQAMRDALDALVDAQTAGQTPLQMTPLWIKLLELYIVPIIRVPPNTLPNPTFPPGGYAPDAPGMTALVNGIATGLYTIFSIPLNIKLRKAVQLCRGHSTPGLIAANEIAREQQWIARFRRNTTEDYGRCAETYPASAISAFAFCSSPAWVNASESLYNLMSKTPVISSITHLFVMGTFFNQFLGGETVESCIPKIKALRQENIGTLLGYNIEAELDGSSKDPDLILNQTQHVLSSIEAQGRLAKQFSPDAATTGGDNRCWVRIKITGLVPHPVALCNGSKAVLAARAARGLDKNVPYPGLPHDGDWDAALNGQGVTQADREQLLRLKATMETIAGKARENSVRIVIDAEQTWYQPVIDALTDELMQKYNALDGGPATCIASFQAYLRRYPQLLDEQIRRADEKGYKLLFKQVRGAYMVTEAERWEKEGHQGPSPVWSTKEETDASFNYGIEKALSTIAEQVRQTGSSRIGAVFATHNSISVGLGIRLLEEYGLAKRQEESGKFVLSKEAAGSITFAQLYGMKDDLTNKITGSIEASGGLALVVKSMSYGDLRECLPFLARRATENKAVLDGRGGAMAERIRLGREIRRRFTPLK